MGSEGGGEWEVRKVTSGEVREGMCGGEREVMCGGSEGGVRSI